MSFREEMIDRVGEADHPAFVLRLEAKMRSYLCICAQTLRIFIEVKDDDVFDDVVVVI